MGILKVIKFSFVRKILEWSLNIIKFVFNLIKIKFSNFKLSIEKNVKLLWIIKLYKTLANTC